MCKWKDGKYQCVCATNGIDYCTGEDAECRNIGGRWTCICVDGYQGYHGDCRGLVLNNVYSMTYRFFYQSQHKLSNSKFFPHSIS